LDGWVDGNNSEAVNFLESAEDDAGSAKENRPAAGLLATSGKEVSLDLDEFEPNNVVDVVRFDAGNDVMGFGTPSKEKEGALVVAPTDVPEKSGGAGATSSCFFSTTPNNTFEGIGACNTGGTRLSDVVAASPTGLNPPKSVKGPVDTCSPSHRGLSVSLTGILEAKSGAVTVLLSTAWATTDWFLEKTKGGVLGTATDCANTGELTKKFGTPLTLVAGGEGAPVDTGRSGTDIGRAGSTIEVAPV